MNIRAKKDIIELFKTHFKVIPAIYQQDRNHFAVEIEDIYHHGVTFTQLMQIRDAMGEFNIEFKSIDGNTTDAGTWFPGEQYILFIFDKPTA